MGLLLLIFPVAGFWFALLCFALLFNDNYNFPKYSSRETGARINPEK